ncbi:DUF4868 domain-containing protein [Serratia sp. S1B]|nr:DUF4868 domain-containing protein [Serratia sp. S1B]
MNLSDIKESVQYFIDNDEDIGVSVYGILKDGGDVDPVKIDIESDALSGLKKLFIQSIKECVFDNEDLAVLNLSSSDERLNAIYVYDLDKPKELTTLQTVIAKDDLPLLNLTQNDLSSIKALLIELGNDEKQIVLYKTLAQVNVFKRSGFFLKKSEFRLEKIDDEFLRISSGFQMFQIDNTLLVVDLQTIEKSFGFHDVIKKEAALGVAEVEKIQLVQNHEVLLELLDDIKYARRFTKIAKSSPVLKSGIPNNEIIKFCQTFPHLTGRIRFNESADKIILDTKVSKDLFIQLLMDNFLTSELTKFYYASVAKDSIDKSAAKN